jgi:hypothetical protein
MYRREAVAGRFLQRKKEKKNQTKRFCNKFQEIAYIVVEY